MVVAVDPITLREIRIRSRTDSYRAGKGCFLKVRWFQQQHVSFVRHLYVISISGIVRHIDLLLMKAQVEPEISFSSLNRAGL